jgi:hypothetical protein
MRDRMCGIADWTGGAPVPRVPPTGAVCSATAAWYIIDLSEAAAQPMLHDNVAIIS